MEDYKEREAYKDKEASTHNNKEEARKFCKGVKLSLKDLREKGVGGSYKTWPMKIALGETCQHTISHIRRVRCHVIAPSSSSKLNSLLIYKN